MSHEIHTGHVLDGLREIPDGSIDSCVTSPPYFGLRAYGTAPQVWGGDPTCDHSWSPQRYYTGKSASIGSGEAFSEAGEANADRLKKARWREDAFCSKCGAWLGELGLEPTLGLFIEHIVQVFEEVRRVLKKEGTAWINLGDSFCSGSKWGGASGCKNSTSAAGGYDRSKRENPAELKDKDLMGVPWRVAFALQDAGWYLRRDIIWCLSGGTWLYVKSQKGVMPMMVRDLARLDPKTVQLWNGEQWTQLLGMNRSERRGTELEVVLRSGERISCTPSHKFPTRNGLKEASELVIGDVIDSVRLPEPEAVKDCLIGEDAAWLAGLYIAEGSMAGDTIQITGHADEVERWARIRRIAAMYGGSATCTNIDNTQHIRIYGKVLVAILAELVTGRLAEDKGVAPVVWRYSNDFLRSLLFGYLSGDGHADDKNRRWRLGFKRNYNLERDLRTLCARLGYSLTLNLSTVAYDGKRVATFRGEIRFARTGHHNEKPKSEVVAIRKARCRYVYDLGVADEPHLFALASGVLTHNSKKNPMPESVRDRPTTAHEYIFLLTKSPRYWYDADAIREPAVFGIPNSPGSIKSPHGQGFSRRATARESFKRDGSKRGEPMFGQTCGTHRPDREDTFASGYRNARSVWEIATQAFPDAHFATFPEEIPRRCILAGCPSGVCANCGTAVNLTHNDNQDLRTMRDSNEPVSKPIRSLDLLQQDVSECCADDAARQLRGVQTANIADSIQSPCAILREGVCEPIYIPHETNHKGICDKPEGIQDALFAGESDGNQDWLRDGASFPDVSKDWASSTEHGSSPPQERDQIRQQDRKPGVNGEAKARSITKDAKKFSSVSALREEDHNVQRCPQCTADLTAKGSIRPGVVLDPFAGSGTTIAVAKTLGRNGIGLELNPEYADMARKRIADAQAPLLEVA